MLFKEGVTLELTDDLKRVSSGPARPRRRRGVQPIFAKLALSKALGPRFGRMGRVPLGRRVAGWSLFPRLSLSRVNVGESVEQPLELAAIAEAAQRGHARLAGGALGRVRRGGAAGHLRGRAKSWQRGCGRRGTGRGRRAYLLSDAVDGEGERGLGGRRRLGEAGRPLVPRARVYGYSSRATAHGRGGKEFGKPVDEPFGFLVNGECSWGGGGREGGSGGGGGGGSGELGGVDRTTGVCNSQSVSGVLHRCSMTR